MSLDPFEAALIVVGVITTLVLIGMSRPALINGGRGTLPRRFELAAVKDLQIPVDAKQPLAYLSERLQQLGFVPADLPMRVPSLSGWGRHLLISAYVQTDERALFIMGIEARWFGGSPLMLHILSPLEGKRRLETTTLTGLQFLIRPPGVDVRVAADVDTLEELWSRHRRALTEYERSHREPVEPIAWRPLAAAAYEAWLQAAVRSSRLKLDGRGQYRIVPRPRSIFG